MESILKANSKQTFIGMWLHDDNLTANQQNQMTIQLNQLFYYYVIFDQIEKFVLYISENRHVAKIFFIISVSNLSLCTLVNLSQECSEIETTYIYSPRITFTPTCFETNDIDDLFEEIGKDIRDFLQRTNGLLTIKSEKDNEPKPFYISCANQISTSICKFISKFDHNSLNPHATDDSIQFFKFLIMTKILLSLSHNTNEISDMWQTCQQIYVNDISELRKIEHLSREYESERAINYYTEGSSVFRTVNQACRTENVQRLYEFRVYINDLHQEIEKLSKTQERNGTKSSIRTVYRGTILSECMLQQLIDNENKLISMNGFLSTTLSSHVSNIYSAVGDNIKEDNRRVRFVLTIDTIKQPYADISTFSAIPDEEEILFSLGTIWRIDAIKFEENLYQIKLTSCNNLDFHLETLLANYTRNECNLSSVGDILRDLGNFEEAEWFYRKMLDQNGLSAQTSGHLYYNMGVIQRKLGRNDKALEYFQEAARLLQSSVTKLHTSNLPREIYKYATESTLIAAYNNMASVYVKNDAFQEAVNCYKQALEVPNGSKLEIAIVYNNLGLLYFRHNSYKPAREYFGLAVELTKEDLSYWVEFKKNLDHIKDVLSTCEETGVNVNILFRSDIYHQD